MKLINAACFAVATVLTLSAAGQAAAAGILIDGNGRQAAAVDTTGYGIAIDPDGRSQVTRGAVDGRNWLSSLLRDWFGWA